MTGSHLTALALRLVCASHFLFLWPKNLDCLTVITLHSDHLKLFKACLKTQLFQTYLQYMLVPSPQKIPPTFSHYLSLSLLSPLFLMLANCDIVLVSYSGVLSSLPSMESFYRSALLLLAFWVMHNCILETVFKLVLYPYK